MMIELYILPQYPTPFPQKLIGEYDLEDLAHQFKFTDDEILAALDGDIVRERFVVRAEPAFYKMQRDVALQAAHEASPQGLKIIELAEVLGLSVGAVKALLFTARQKLMKSKKLKACLQEVIRMRKVEIYTVGRYGKAPY